MLEIIPYGAYRSLTTISSSSRYGNLVIGMRKPDAPTYKISYKPEAGKRNAVGNRPVDHFQVHGRVNQMGPGMICTHRSVQGQSGVGPPSIAPYTDTDVRYPITSSTSISANAVLERDMGKRTSQCSYGSETYPCYAFNLFGCVDDCFFLIELSTGKSRQSLALSQSFVFVQYDKTTGLFRFRRQGSYNPTFYCTWFGKQLKCGRGYQNIVWYPSTDAVVDWLNANPSVILNEMRSLAEQIYDYMIVYPISTSSSLSSSYPTGIYAETIPLKSSELSKLKRHLLLDALQACEPPSPTPVDLGEATQSAVSSFAYTDANTAVLISELRHIVSGLRDVVTLLQQPVSAKTLSKLWLSYRYGVRLTVGDSISLMRDTLSYSRKRRHCYELVGSHQYEGGTIRCRLYADPDNSNELSRIANLLQRWDLFPSLSNVWDLIPYSFVVDWFIDVEGFLSDIDSQVQYSTLQVFSALYTWKKEWTFDSRVVGNFRGTIRATRFVRECPKKAYPTIPSFSGFLPSENNVLDGAALIIQQLK